MIYFVKRYSAVKREWVSVLTTQSQDAAIEKYDQLARLCCDGVPEDLYPEGFVKLIESNPNNVGSSLVAQV